MINWFKNKSDSTELRSEGGQEYSRLYHQLGGETGIRALSNSFYDEMETLPDAAELLSLHPQPLDSIRQRFFEFLSGWTGGPGLFEQKHGHPRLRARHLPFKVDKAMRDQWMLCMTRALDKEVSCQLTRMQLRQSFYQLADHMRNVDEN